MLKNLRTLRKYFRRYRRGMLAGVLFLLFCNACEVAIPPVIGMAVNSLKNLQAGGQLQGLKGVVDLTGYAPLQGIVFLVLAVIFVQLTRAVFSFLQRTFIVRISRRIECDLRVDYFAHLQKLPPSYYDNVKTGDLMARCTNDLLAVRMALGPCLMLIFNTLFISAGALVVMFVVKPDLALYVMIPLMVLPALTGLFGGPIKKRFQKIQEQFGDINIACQENFSGIRVIKAFVREEHEKKKFRALNREYAIKNIALAKVRALFRPLLFLIVGIAFAVVYWMGSVKVIAGTMNIGELIMFEMYVGLLIFPMVALGWVVVLLQQADASMGRINSVLEQSPTIFDRAEAEPLGDVAGEIESRNLTFTYPGCERPALAGVNLRIAAGSTVAIVGPAGSGKSTFVKLIARLYEVGENRLFIDGKDVTAVRLKDLRAAVGFVPQETFLFSDSIAANIRYGAPDADEEAVRRAADVSQISADVEQLREGYAQILGERGISLSGGQKQRVAIARAVILDAPILILDDALSSVDAHTEERILERLRDVMKRRTSIIISHRLSSIQYADNIVVIEDGRITEQGTHAELMKGGGFYAETYKRQQLEDSLLDL